MSPRGGGLTDLSVQNGDRKDEQWFALPRSFPRNADAQRRRPAPIQKRRLHEFDFAIARHQKAAFSRLDAGLGDAKSIEVFRLIDSPEESVEGEPEKSQPSGAMSEIQSQVAGIHAGSRPKIEARDLVLVVA